MKRLVQVIASHARALREQRQRFSSVVSSLDNDTFELISVLRRIVGGMPILKAFGAPGDWGYDTPIGAALAHHRKVIENDRDSSLRNLAEHISKVVIRAGDEKPLSESTRTLADTIYAALLHDLLHDRTDLEVHATEEAGKGGAA